MKIKVCGLKSFENMQEVQQLPVDFIGFIFYDQSPRFVTLSKDELARLPLEADRVGVFVNEQEGFILHQAQKYQLSHVQLHGNETPELCESLKKAGLKVIKAFGIDESFEWEQLNTFENNVDYFLFDTKSAQHGGTGTAFDWNILAQYTLNTPYFLSGGLRLENLSEIKADDRLYALDLNSKFELKPGIKDIELLKKALKTLHHESISSR